jgi:hypothetical protein
MTIGNGQSAKFWEDRSPDLYACIPKTRTVADGLAANHWAQDIHGTIGINELGQYLRLWQLPDLEVAQQWQVHRQIGLSRIVAGLHQLRFMEAHMEELGA